MKLDNIIKLAREGDVGSQKFLLDQCKELIVPLSYKYLSKCIVQGIPFDDVKDLAYPAFIKTMNTYRQEGIPFYDYFKYLYLMEVKTAIRNQIRINNRPVSLQDFDPDDDYSNIVFHTSSYEVFNEDYSDFDKQEIVSLIVNRQIPKVTDKEYMILLLFLQGMNMREISSTLSRDYSETSKSFRKSINKIKAYLKVK